MSVEDLQGARILVVGASSGIGRQVATAASRRGARLAVAARRTALLDQLCGEIDASAHHLDITEPAAIRAVVDDAARALGGIDVVVCTSGVLPFVRIEHIDAATWAYAFATNAVGPSLLISAALPYLSDDALILITTSDDHRRTRVGTAAYSASKTALDEILRAWRYEHPRVRVLRAALGPVAGTEILRGADRELLNALIDEWTAHGQLPRELADVVEIGELLVQLVIIARKNPTLVTEDVRLSTRVARRALKVTDRHTEKDRQQ